MKFKLTIVLLSIFITKVIFCQNQEIQNQAIQTDTIGSKNISTLIVPLAFYSPETSFAFGGGGQLFFRTKKSKSDALNSNVLLSAIYTLKKQLIIEIQPQIYYNYENYYLDSKFRYKVFPNLFWGIGQNSPDSVEENYNQTEISFNASFIKRLDNNVNFGFGYYFSNYKLTEIESDGILATESIEGFQGASLRGLGIIVNIDSRDNKYSPLKGEYFQFSTNFTSRVLGSSHSFNTYFLDLRKYYPLGSKHILAIQLYTRFTFGNSPFQAKSFYGGSDVARGYFKGRYIDDYLYVFQAEYRLPLSKRWEIAGFALTGNVGSNQPENGLFESYKPSFGLGPRFFIYKNKRTLLRLDFAVNKIGESGIYFGVNEAF